MGWHANDLARLGSLLDRLPQRLHRDRGNSLRPGTTAARRPGPSSSTTRTASSSARTPTEPSEFPYYWRTFETADEYFDYYRRYHAFWKLYGMDLPDDVLRKVYYQNALRVIPGIDRGQFPAR